MSTAALAARPPPAQRELQSSRQPEPQSALGADHVLCIPDPVRDLLPDPALLHGRHRAQERRRGGADGDQSVDHRRRHHARSIQNPADADRLSGVLQEHHHRDGVHGGDHHGGQRVRRLLARPHEILGLGHPGDRDIPHLSRARHAAVHPAVPDRQSARAAQFLLGHGAGLSDADRAVLHLDHDRLFPVDTRRSSTRRR